MPWTFYFYFFPSFFCFIIFCFSFARHYMTLSSALMLYLFINSSTVYLYSKFLQITRDKNELSGTVLLHILKKAVMILVGFFD